MKFTVSNDPKEIEKVIKKSVDNHESIAWQSTPDSRTVFQIEQVHVDNLRKIIRFKLDDSSNLQLNPDLIVYVKLSFRNTIFKGELIGAEDNFTFVNIPDEIQFEELREFPRFNFTPQEDKSCTLSIDSELVAKSLFNLKVKLLDISQTGLGLIVTPSNHDLIRNNDLIMTALGSIELAKGIGAKVVYAAPHAYRLEGKRIKCFRMGAKLDGFLEQELIEAFIKSIEGFDHSSIGFLGNDFEFQNSLHSQMDTMLKHLKSKNDLFYSVAQATESAKVTKEEEYFPRHIKILAKVSCGIAQILGMDTKKVVQKLIYASFVHDVAFYANPKLSLIKNLDHFEQAKGELTLEEQELFENAPKHAFDFAFYDKYAPKGVESIIIQAKELPSGKGFPNKLDAERISPLSAIFIVAHDLTDYIFERKSWNYHDYLKSYRTKFEGGFFDEILDHLEKARQSAA